jgi:hypothetical protein
LDTVQPIARLCAALLCVALTGFTAPALAATPVPIEIVRADFESLIKAAAESQVQYAVHVPHPVSSKTMGHWQVANDRARWQYAVRIPTAVSMSFHATHIELPVGATLSVRGLSTTVVYRGQDLHNAELWSRIQPGDSLKFTLEVSAADRGSAVIEILSFQAGYRSLGAGVKDHPVYQRKKIQAPGSSNTTCVQNYECNVSPANTPQGQAAVALTISNLYQCSGTLVNDVPGDDTPYVWTARHCESGKLGGGNPGAAAAVTVYWDATTPCGGSLGSLYDPGIPVQTGATTVVEQEDAWLIRLAATPVVADAEFAGFDASGGAVQGGYTIHHALGYDKQYTAWFGQAFALQQANVLGTTYTSHFWETVNQSGNIGPGASGSGLFDQANHLVGSLTLGRTTTDTSGYESCPAPSPPAPNGSNGTGDFTSLAAIWNSTADATSTTGTATMKSVLDPANTGTTVVAAAAAPSLNFSSSFSAQTQGLTVPLSWTANGAIGCTAGGGVTGDGWTGSLPASGTQSVSDPNTGSVTYTIGCTYPGGRAAHAAVTISWRAPNPTATLTSNRDFLWTTRPVVLSWLSNASSCTLAGGSLTLTGLPGSGSTTTTQTTAGDVTYVLTCGTIPNDAKDSTTVTYQTPSLVFEAIAADRLLGQPFEVAWLSYADSCIPAGGAPNDGWTNSTQPNLSQPWFDDPTTTLGTYTFSLTCLAGPLSVQKSVTVKLENGAPFVTTSADKTQVTYSATAADYINLQYTSNLTLCTLAMNPNGAFLGVPTPPVLLSFGGNPEGSYTLAPQAPGTYVLTVTCTAELTLNTQATSAPITIKVLPPAPPTATISVNPSTVTTGQVFTINWSSTNAASCVASGGNALQGPFVGNLSSTSGSLPDNSSSTGSYTLGVSCQSIDASQGAATASTTLTVAFPPPPTVTVTASPEAVAVGGSFMVTWSSTNATSCTSSGGGANGATWIGTLATSGSVTQTATVSGSFTYSVTCSNSVGQVSAGKSITVSAPSTGGGSKSGGGGAIGATEIGALAALLAFRRRRRAAGLCQQ